LCDGCVFVRSGAVLVAGEVVLGFVEEVGLDFFAIFDVLGGGEMKLGRECVQSGD
jgi:hypothetical protein